MKTIKAAFRIFMLIPITLFVTITTVPLLLMNKSPLSYYTARLWHVFACIVFNIKVRVVGTPVTDQQVMYVSNHISYLDITTIGAVIRGSFVAKSEIKSWPVMGHIGKLQQTIYISRKREDTNESKKMMEDVLNRGSNIIIFPEGTSSDGSTVLPFKSSFFTVALDNPAGKPLLVQPITAQVISLDKTPVTTQAQRDQFCWYGDMTLAPHIWNIAKMRGLEVQLTFHEPIDAATYTDRKALAQDCYNDVLSGLNTQPLVKAA